jgi:hypothetical protein
MPTKGHSTVVQYNAATTYAGSSSWTTLGTRINDVEPGMNEAEDIDISHMFSADQREEFTAGWSNSGEAKLTLQYVNTEFQNIHNTLYRQDKGWRIVFYDGSGVGWSGYIKSFGPKVERKRIVTQEITIKISGATTYFSAS